MITNVDVTTLMQWLTVAASVLAFCLVYLFSRFVNEAKWTGLPGLFAVTWLLVATIWILITRHQENLSAAVLWGVPTPIALVLSYWMFTRSELRTFGQWTMTFIIGLLIPAVCVIRLMSIHLEMMLMRGWEVNGGVTLMIGALCGGLGLVVAFSRSKRTLAVVCSFVVLYVAVISFW